MMRSLAVIVAAMTAGCTVQGNVEQIYSMTIDEKATSPDLDRVIEADRELPHVSLGPDVMGLRGPRLIALDPAGDVREGLMVSQDARTHSRDVQDRMNAHPNVEVTRRLDIGESEGGAEMLRSLANHPVMLAKVRFDCRRNLVTFLSYHTADTFAGPFARSYVVPAPEDRPLAGPMREAACTGVPGGLKPSSPD